MNSHKKINKMVFVMALIRVSEHNHALRGDLPEWRTLYHNTSN
jgi:hypothetical protein